MRTRSARKCRKGSKGSTAMGRVHAQKLFAYWLTSVGSLAMQYSFSIIFVDLLVAFDSTRAATAAVGSLCAGLMDGFGVVSGRSIARRGEVACGSLGALLSGLGLIASSQCTTLWQLYVTYGVMLGAAWKSTGVSGAQVISRRCFSAMTWPRWLRRAVRNRYRHAIEQVSRRWRGGRRGDSGRTRRKFDFHTGWASANP